MLERSAGGRYARSVFFETYNDFDIFIEDTAEGYPKIFATLLGRAMSSSISIHNVHPLGSRFDVIEAAKVALESSSRRKSVFIVDGDLYLLCGEYESLPSNVVRLPRYCVENFLLDANAFLKVLNSESSAFDSEYLKLAFDYDGWFRRSVTTLMPLFLTFAAAHGLRSGVKNVAHGSKSVCGNQNAEVNEDKANKLNNEILSSLEVSHGVDDLSHILGVIRGNIDSSLCFLSTYVSAKDFLLPLLMVRLRTLTPTTATNLSVKLRLASECDVNPLRGTLEDIAAVVEMPQILNV